LSDLGIETIFLPRQARDKHRESTQKKRPFSRRAGFVSGVRAMMADHELLSGKDTRLLRATFHTKNGHHFTKTGSGQT
jgi:hypothetical protein